MLCKKFAVACLAAATVLGLLFPAQRAFAGYFLAFIQSHPPAISHQATGDFIFSSTGPVECKIDSGAFSPCDTPYTTPALANGEHTLTLHAIDADNPEGTATYTWTVDVPEVSITSPTTSTIIFDGPLTVVGTSPENVRIEIGVDGVVAGTTDVGNSTNWQFTIPHVAAGNHAISAQVQSRVQYAYLANRSFGTIDVVDVLAKSYVQEIVGSDAYYATIFNAHTYKMYAASVWNNSCAVKTFNPTTFAIEQSVYTGSDGSSPVSMALDPSGNTLYEICYDGFGDYFMVMYDTNTNATTGSFILGLDPGEYPSGIAITPNNGQIWVRLNGGIRIYDVSSHVNVQTVNLNPGNNAVNNIVFNQDGSKAYTAESDTSDVYIINTSDYSVTNHLVDSYISNLAFTPDYSKLYAISSGASSIYVFDPANLDILDQQTTTQPPESLAITDDGLSFVVGDDHGSGQIYFGATSGNATVTNTVTAPNGGSYYTSTGNFIGPAFYLAVGNAAAVALSVKSSALVPNTGLGRR